MAERAGEICLLRELLNDPNVQGKYVRVTGYVVKQDFSNPEQQLVQISHDGSSIWVDISLVVAKDLKVDSLVQFIGQINLSSTGAAYGSWHLSAKVFRGVDGLDMRLYEEALLARREFLAAMA